MGGRVGLALTLAPCPPHSNCHAFSEPGPDPSPARRPSLFSIWDHCITLTVTCGEAVSEVSFDTRDDTSASTDLASETPLLGEPGGKVNEMWRGITTFRRRNGRWLTGKKEAPTDVHACFAMPR